MCVCNKNKSSLRVCSDLVVPWSPRHWHWSVTVNIHRSASLRLCCCWLKKMCMKALHFLMNNGLDYVMIEAKDYSGLVNRQ